MYSNPIDNTKGISDKRPGQSPCPQMTHDQRPFIPSHSFPILQPAGLGSAHIAKWPSALFPWEFPK